MIVIVKHINKNNRYRVAIEEKKIYLIDTDKNIFGFIFFPINWYSYQTAYVIDQRTLDDLCVQKINNDSKQKHNILLSSVFMIIIFSIVVPLVINCMIINISIKIILLLISEIIAPIYTRVIISKSDKSRLNLFNTNSESIKLIKIWPTNRLSILKNLMLYIFYFICFIIGAFLLIVLKGYWLISLCFYGACMYILFSNRMYLNDGTYKIKER